MDANNKKVCPQCNGMIDVEAKFCMHCGYQFPAPQPEMIECPHCRQRVPASAQFCPSCGSRMGSGTQLDPIDQKPFTQERPAVPTQPDTAELEEEVHTAPPRRRGRKKQPDSSGKINFDDLQPGEKVQKDGMTWTVSPDKELISIGEDGTQYMDAASYFASWQRQKAEQAKTEMNADTSAHAPADMAEQTAPLAAEPVPHAPPSQATSAPHVSPPPMHQSHEQPMQAPEHSPVPGAVQEVPPVQQQAAPASTQPAQGQQEAMQTPTCPPHQAVPQVQPPMSAQMAQAQQASHQMPYQFDASVQSPMPPMYGQPTMQQQPPAQEYGWQQVASGQATQPWPTQQPAGVIPNSHQAMMATPDQDEEQADPLTYLSQSKKKKRGETPDDEKEKKKLFQMKANQDGYYDDRRPYDDGMFDEGPQKRWLPTVLMIAGIAIVAFVLIQVQSLLG